MTWSWDMGSSVVPLALAAIGGCVWAVRISIHEAAAAKIELAAKQFSGEIRALGEKMLDKVDTLTTAVHSLSASLMVNDERVQTLTRDVADHGARIGIIERKEMTR